MKVNVRLFAKGFLSLFLFVSFACGAETASNLMPEARVATNTDLEGPHRYYFAVTAMFQDEGPWLKEWIEYHKMLGVEHFYLYNNLSTDEYFSVLEDYVESGEVDLIDWPFESSGVSEHNRNQVNAYRDALERSDCKWLAIIDIDEFLVPVIWEDLSEMLLAFDGIPWVGGVVFPWVFFGTSNVDRIGDNELLIEALTLNGGYACGGNRGAIWNQGAYKSIVRPDAVRGCGSPHYCTYKPGLSHTMVAFNKGQINHYWTRDETYLHEKKVPRRIKWGQSEATTLSWAAGMRGDNELGQRITRFVPRLKSIMEYDDLE